MGGLSSFPSPPPAVPGELFNSGGCQMATREESVTNTSLIASHPHLDPPPSSPLLSTPFSSSSFLYLLFNPQHYISPPILYPPSIPSYFFRGAHHKPALTPIRGVTKRCRLSWLTNNALLYEPKCGGEGGVSGSQPMSKAVYIT